MGALFQSVVDTVLKGVPGDISVRGRVAVKCGIFDGQVRAGHNHRTSVYGGPVVLKGRSVEYHVQVRVNVITREEGTSTRRSLIGHEGVGVEYHVADLAPDGTPLRNRPCCR